MKNSRAIFVVLFISLLGNSVASSKEAVAPVLAREVAVPFATFSSTSDGIGNSGPISVSGTQGKGRIRSLTIKVFSRTIDFEKEGLINQLKGTLSNSYQISYEQNPKGYKGRVLRVTFYAGTSYAQKIIVIKDNGSVNILSPMGPTIE